MQRIDGPGDAALPDERATIAAQLGRDARGQVAVAARCPYGLPAVVRTSPRLDDGSPFPTLFYVTCPVAVRDIGTMEASGEMRRYEAALASDPDLRAAYADADRRYRARRDALVPLGEQMQTAGGMPQRVKCLHALYAHELADGNPIGALVRERIEPLDCPGPCVVGAARVPGHPGFRGKRGR